MDPSNRKRVLLLSSAVFMLFAVLLAQFFRIQVLEREKWQRRAEQQHYFYIVEPFERGTFWANTSIKKGHPEIPQKLAVDIRKYHLFVDPASIPGEYRKEIAQHVIAIARPSQQECERLYDQFEKKSRSRRLVSWLDEEKKQAVSRWWQPYAKQRHIPSNALFFVGDALRSHPFGKLLGQVLHTVQMQKNEQTRASVPTGGLELSCDSYLSGTLGKRRLMRSPRHSLHMQQVIKEPEHGCDVFLTINHYIQAIAEEELEKGVQLYKAKGGWAIVMDPHTGHILALAQYPFFYPDHYPTYFKDPELIQHAKIKAITDANEPGSTMKPITLAIALKANKERLKAGQKALFHPLEKIETSKGNFPGRGKKPLTDTRLHYYMNMYLGMQKSSNIYFATLVQRIVQSLGDGWYRKELHDTFGFGSKTHIELPGESVGVLPTPGKKHPNNRLEWSVATPVSLAIGYNVQATTLQMVRAYAIFANGGYFVEPTLIKKIVKRSGEVLVDNTRSDWRSLFPRVVDEDIVNEVVKATKFVTKAGGATNVADVFGYTEAGKSGTSMKIVGGHYSDKSHFASFVGFTPVQNTAFVIMVGLDEPEAKFIPGRGLNHMGGTCAAPVFREIARRSLEYLGVPPDDPHGYPRGDPRHDPAKADWYKETLEMAQLYQEWNGKAKK
ncbi:MAG: penicillin-binding protein 2 [Verrucomicrobia bacterium]|nr:penicillin-binding protein 2 [Verrucomicrobiota bacterium]